jgi:prepilin-type N-terminal cleavage/methylation domain-containing protein
MNHDNKKGFTLIELMLSMTFLSVLLLAIAMTVLQIGNIYNRGLTLKEVNQAGRSLSNELKRSIAQSATFSVDYPAAGTKFIDRSWGGRLCLGQFSYIWNYGTTLKDASANGSNSNVYTAASNEKIRFIKVSDPTSEYCALPTSPAIDPDGAVEILSVGDRDLAVHSFNISYDNDASDPLTGQRVYSVSFILGTNDQGALDANSSTCKAPNESQSDLVYCSVNEFNITARTSNAVQ